MSIRKLESIVDLSQQLKTYNNKEYVYCSIGSKHNEDNSSFRYPSRDILEPSNAEYQMIPQFVRYKHGNTLVIIIDQFTDEILYNNNMIILNNIIEMHNNIEILLVNHKFDCENMNEAIVPILSYLHESNIHENQFMLANYICFRTTNLLDTEMEDKFRNLLQSLLHNTLKGVYRKCFYQWFGYMYLFYDYIFNYNEYYIFAGLHINSLLSKCYTITKNKKLNNFNKKIIANNFINDDNLTQKWSYFLNNSINIVELY